MFRNAVLLAAATVWAQHAAAAMRQNLVSSISFGQDDKISPNGRAIPNWHLTGEAHTPQLLSDRIILTPPAPGHARGALWGDNSNSEKQWSADTSFRASGQDRGSGNFQIWYVKDGRTAIGSNSVYTVPKFEGLVLTVDQHGGKGGMLRGFLNDGTVDYKGHHMVDSLSFGHCNFPYRNLGRYSKVTINHDQRGLEVKVDDQPCFSSDKVALPDGYFFGMTAATSDNPDSFEVSSFSVMTTKTTAHPGKFGVPQQQQSQARAQPAAGQEQHHLPNAPEQLPDVDAASFKRQEEQFADLHNRLQGMSHQVNSLFGEFDRISKTLSDRHSELLSKLPKSSDDNIMSLGRRVENIEQTLNAIRQDLSGRDYKQQLDTLHKAVEGVKGGLSVDLPDTLHQVVKGSAPKITTFVFIVIGVQVLLLGLYLVYKRRRDSAPKKYL